MRDFLQPLITIQIGIQVVAGQFVTVTAVVDTGAQVSAIPRSMVNRLSLKTEPTGDVRPLVFPNDQQEDCPIFEMNLMFSTRDGGTSILDGCEIAMLPTGNHVVLGLDILVQYEYRIADGVLYLLKEKPKSGATLASRSDSDRP